MNTRTRISAAVRAGLLGTLLATGMLSAPANAGIDVDIAIAPPALRFEAVPAPRAGYAWAPGYWRWGGTAHVWVPGRWNAGRAGYHYAPERWENRGGKYHFVRGGWEAGEARDDRQDARQEVRHDERVDKRHDH